jgi:hypothetical protein
MGFRSSRKRQVAVLASGCPGKWLSWQVAVLSLCGVLLAALLGLFVESQASASTSKAITLRFGDAVRIPALQVRCEVSAEAGTRDFICTRTSVKPRYRVVFYRDATYVYGPSGPEKPTVFYERH